MARAREARKEAGADVHAVGEKKHERKKSNKRDLSHLTCYNCQKKGHMAKDCRSQAVAPVEGAPPKEDGASANQDTEAAAHGINARGSNPMMDHFYRD